MNIINAKNLIWLAIFSAPLYLVKFYLFGIPANIPEVLIITAFILWLVENKNFSWRNFCNQHKKILAGIFLIFLGLVISALSNPNHLAEWGIIKSWFVIPLMLSFVLVNEIKNKENVENIFKALYFSAAIVGLIGLIYFFKGDLTYDFRLKSFFLSPNYLAMFLSPAIFIGNYFIISRIKNNAWRLIRECVTLILLFLSQAVIMSALYFTYSYAAWIAVILSLIVINLIIKNSEAFKKIKIIAILLIILSTILITQTGNPKFNELFNWQSGSRSSLVSRVMIWQSAEKILRDNFLWGIGPGNFQSKYLEYQKYFPPYLEWAVPQPHNLYLAFWLQSGILGLAGFLYLAFNWIRGIIKIIRENTSPKNDLKKIAPVLLGIMLYILLHGIADTPCWKNDLAIIFWTIFSLGAVSINFNEKFKLETPPLEKRESERKKKRN